MRLPSYFLSAALFLGAATLTAQAQRANTTTDVPRSISYQGMLTSTDGTPLADGVHNVLVTLYSDPQGNLPLWQETYQTQVTGGVFSLYLGTDGKTLPDAATMNRPLWIGTSVNNGEEMRPLSPLTAAPYALNVPDHAITANKLAPLAVTADKVDMDYISELRIDGQKVSSKGTTLNLVSTPGVPLQYDEATQSLRIGEVPASRGNVSEEKGAQIMATNNDVWTMRGNGRNLTSGLLVTPATGDWLGTTNGVDLDFRVNNIRVMRYQQTGTGVPNVIGGDLSNTITAAASMGSIVAEGKGNSIATGDYNVISGGENNGISQGGHTVVAGGENNTTSQGDHNVIGGGIDNTISVGDFNTVAGGNTNDAQNGNYNAVGGGFQNSAQYVDYGTVGGGTNNRILNPGGFTLSSVTISGGKSNEAEIDFTTIGGGEGNAIRGNNPGTTEHSTISGGQTNLIDGTSNHAVIAGGQGNTVTVNGPYAAIGGGGSNFAQALYTTVAGGSSNTTATGSDYATVGGGEQNLAQGTYSTIPGGDRLITNASYGQVAVGFYNDPRLSAMPTQPTAAQIAASNDPLFMVGNGVVISGTRSNAFEVSYNGHTSVYHVNNSGAINAAITGGTFADNVILAWGDVPDVAAIPPVTITPTADFGVMSVTQTAVGVYDILLNVTDPAGNAIIINGSSVTATIEDDASGTYSCYNISATSVGATGVGINTFRIRITDNSCLPADAPFMFKVTGR